ncbi:hypothetical protein LIER_11347 [Lithospermum erythrorhizon]|uniref:Uncharacterized protein n=1 Tax=Lithospermum erythrorhizon TaxID=34254 RepID=A0AAV3PMS9_LITER
MVIGSLALSGCLTQWPIEISKFDLTYAKQTSIKAQALADFIMESTARPPHVINALSSEERDLPMWNYMLMGCEMIKGQQDLNMRFQSNHDEICPEVIMGVKDQHEEGITKLVLEEPEDWRTHIA